MKLLCTYANNCSVDLPDKPADLPVQYFPAPAAKYITLQNSSGMPAKDYDLWQDVVNLIYPYLQKQNIEIIQIGKGDIRPLNKTISLVNQTTFSQSVYVLKNALLHAGNDSWAAHAASETPVIILYGSTSISAHSPFYYNSRSKFIESARNGKNPSFQAQENPKTVNLIKPEYVAKEILSILEIPHEINQNTFFIGDLYNQPCLEIIPDCIINPQSIPQGNIVIRGDLLFNQSCIIENLKLRPYILHLAAEIDINVLKALKSNIPLIILEIAEETNLDYIKSIISAGINLQLITLLDEESHNNLKLKYLDYPLIFRKDDVKFNSIVEKIRLYNNFTENQTIEFLQSIQNKEVKYLSSKHILSNGKLYLSSFDYQLDRPAESMESFSVGDLNNQEFINEMQSFLLYV